VYEANAVSILVKQTNEAFLQVTNYGIDRITVGMRFRTDVDAKHFMELVQQSPTQGILNVVCVLVQGCVIHV